MKVRLEIPNHISLLFTLEIVAQLQAQIKELEKRESLYKDKLKEEHAQLVNFQKKLAQAGSHLKTLAQENATLNKSMAQEKNEKNAALEEKQRLETERTKEREQWEKKYSTLETTLTSSQQGHQKEIKQLVNILETSATKHGEVVTPDVSTSTLLDNYMKSVQKRLSKSNGPVKGVCFIRKQKSHGY